MCALITEWKKTTQNQKLSLPFAVNVVLNPSNGVKILLVTVCMYNFSSGVNFCGEKFCGNFYSRELIFADRRKKITKLAKIKTTKNLCDTESLV